MVEHQGAGGPGDESGELFPELGPFEDEMGGAIAPAGPAPTSPRVGRTEAWEILLFSTDDGSISGAMQNGGITRIHHVDHETQNIQGIWSKDTTIVYGE
jgi:hypothetical protein